jgi:DNA-binding response OmpR family regulator
MPNESSAAKRVFVVDDSAMAVTVTVQLLNEAGYIAEGQIGSGDAMERIRELKPDFVISDVMMPGVNGFELLNMIRGNDNLDHVRIIMASAKAYEADRIKAKKLGADGYIVKPFTLEKFAAIVNSLDTMTTLPVIHCSMRRTVIWFLMLAPASRIVALP